MDTPRTVLVVQPSLVHILRPHVDQKRDLLYRLVKEPYTSFGLNSHVWRFRRANGWERDKAARILRTYGNMLEKGEI